MNWDRIEGQWKQRRGKALRHWGTMMNDELAIISGKYTEVVGKLQERCGMADEKIEQLDGAFKLHCTACRQETVKHLKNFNGKLAEMEKLMNTQKKVNGLRVKSKAQAKKRSRVKPGT